MTEPVCPYCRMPFDDTGPAKVLCKACGTPHHQDCYQENGGCTVFGCSCAPADDPKLQLSHSDLSAVRAPAPPAIAAPAPMSPAPPPGTMLSTQPSYGGSRPGLSQPVAAPPPPGPALGVAAQPAFSNHEPPPPPPPPPMAPGYPYPYSQAQVPGYQYGADAMIYGQSAKTRTTYIVLGIFLGWLGIHNFYAGYSGKAVGQLCLTVLTLGYLAIISWIWAIIEVCIVEQDSAGMRFV